MRQFRKSTAAAMAGLGALALLAAPSLAASDQAAGTAGTPVQLAHMAQGQARGWSGQPCPGGVMGPGMMGQGTMAPGMGNQGMMGQGMGGQGMMGPGMMGPGAGRQGMMGPGFGSGPGVGGPVMANKDLSADDVRHFLEHRLEMHDNKRLKVGEVKPTDDDKIVADITTVDGSLVQRLEVNRHTGQMQQID
jgi:hypothetical protein